MGSVLGCFGGPEWPRRKDSAAWLRLDTDVGEYSRGDTLDPPMAEPSTSTPGSDLVARAAAGDRAAWQTLVERHAGLVWSVVRRGGVGRDAGEDIVQEVFVAALRALPGLKEHDRFEAWLVTTTKRLVWKSWSARRRQGDELPDELVGAEADAGALTSAQETRIAVQRGLDQLPERCRGLLLAAFAEGPPPDYDRLAVQLGVPRGSLGPTRARCLEQLAKVLTAMGLGRNA
ncbi:MAG: hypothetical protein RLZZ246_134 [Planctomycetota bacterium]